MGRTLINHIKVTDPKSSIVAILREGSSPHVDIAEKIDGVIYYNGKKESLYSPHFQEASTLFHLAAYYTNDNSFESNQELLESNIRFPMNLLHTIEKASRMSTMKVVTPSTFSAYNEDFEYAPYNVYSVTKDIAEEIFMENDYVRVGALVMSDTYGPGDTRGKLHDKIYSGAIKTLTCNPNKEMVLNHMEDVARAFLHLNSILDTHLNVKYDLMYEENRITLGELGKLISPNIEIIETEDPVTIPHGKFPMPNFNLKYNVYNDLLKEIGDNTHE